MERGDEALSDVVHELRDVPANNVVIARLDRATQYSRALVFKRQRSGILGHPLSRVVTACNE
jgi:hypothetical protein